MKPNSFIRTSLALTGSSLLAISSASAQTTYYWDGNDGTTGFGTAGGTWAAPTTGTATSGWSTSATGITTVNGNSVTTATNDTLNFGTNTVGNGLAAGTITVSGTVNASSITFGSQSGAVELSGGTINLAAAGQITLSGGAITINSVISGAGTSLTKVGNSQLTLTGLNTYTGATRIGSSTGGYLAVTHIANGGIASGIGASSSAASNLVLANDNFGGLNYIGSTNASTDRDFTIANGGGAYSGAIASSGTGTLTFTSTNAVSYITSNAARNFQLAGSNTGQNTLNARLVNNGTGALSFSKTGGGTWVLANETNSYTGATTVSGGVLSVSKMADYGTDSSIGKGTAGAGIVFNGGGLNYIGSGDDTNRLIQLTNSGTILNNGTGALNFTATATPFNVQASTANSRTLSLGGTNGGTISGVIQNNTGTAPALGLAKIGTGTWTLGAQNTYNGTTAVNAGTLRLQSGATTITQTLGALANQLAEGTLNSNKSGTGSITTNFSSYSRTAGATGNITITGGTNGSDNSVNITGAAGFINAGLFFGGSEFAARNATDGFLRALNYATTGGDTNTVDVNTVTASRHVKLNAPASSFSGTGITLLSLNLQGDNVNWTNTSGTLVAPGILKSGGGSSTISGGNVNGGSNAELVVRTDLATDNLTINSILNLGNTGGQLTKSGAGTLTLGGINTYQGPTHVNAGTLSISANNNLGAEATGATLNLKGGTLQATGTFGLFNGTAGTNNRAVTLLDQSGIEVTGSNTLTIAGVISNNANAGVTRPGFNKTGTGTLLLSGTNTYTGATTVNAGRLTVSSTGSVNSSSAVNVAAGATFVYNSSTALDADTTLALNGVDANNRAVFGGTATINQALTLDNVGDVLAPGNSPGIQTFGVGQTWSSFSYDWELNDWTAAVAGTNIDQIQINGILDLAAVSANQYILNILSLDSLNASGLVGAGGGNPFSEISRSWNILTTTGGITGFNASEWLLNTAGFLDTETGTWSIAQSGNNLVLNYTVIPEPTTALLGSLGLLLLLRRRRA